MIIIIKPIYHELLKVSKFTYMFLHQKRDNSKIIQLSFYYRNSQNFNITVEQNILVHK